MNQDAQGSTPKGVLRLCSRLQLDEVSAASLVAAMQAGASSRSAVVLSAHAPQDYQPPFACAQLDAPWLPPRVFVPESGEEKPTAHPDYAAGLYYVLDLSSCWESACLAQVPPPASSLDMCAAPGGKTMLMAARFGALNHTANEVHAGRRGILRQNLQQCGYPQVRVTGNRPDQWSRSGECFDLVLVDAPCSGQSLLCKGIRNPGCLSSSMVNGNAKRQKGIMLSVLPCVNSGGHVVYTTCTYDPEENEKVMAYILKRHADWEAVEIPLLSTFSSSLVDFPAYRLLPEHGYGAGGFCCLLRKKSK